jgi:prevent-host-death family protein
MSRGKNCRVFLDLLYELLYYTLIDNREKVMEAITASSARKNLFSLLASVAEDDEPRLITSRNGNGVLISEREWESIRETNYLMSNPKTRQDILEGIDTPLSECVRIEL